MPVKRNKQLAILKRRRDVADLYLQGWTQTAIAEEMRVGQPTVCDDLKRIRAEWRESAVRDFDEARQLELMKLDRIERESWSAWDQSKKPAQSAVVTGDGTGQKTRKSMKNQHGDHRSWTRSTSASRTAGPCWAWTRRWESRRESMSYPW